MHWVTVGNLERHQRVASLMVRRGFPLGVREDQAPALDAQHDLVLGILEVPHVDLPLVPPGGKQGRFVGEVGQIGPGHPRRPLGQHTQTDVWCQRNLPGMDTQDTLAAADVRQVHYYLAVEPSRTQQCRVEHIGPVGRGEENDSVIRFEPVHLHQQLV